MASPQKENGHVEIANDLFEALCHFDMPGRQRRVFDAIMRKTWGWGKKSDRIPLSQIASLTGVKIKHVCEMLNWLKKANMITRDLKGNTRILKDFDSWVLPPAGVPYTGLPPKGIATPAEGDQLLPPAGDSKDILSKDTLQKTEEAQNENMTSIEILNEKSKPLSPKDEAKLFFQAPPETLVSALVARGIPEQFVRSEIAKFCAYWTELNKTGTKQKWEMQETFQVKRRLSTWFQNTGKYGQRFSQPTKKGITID